ncbi:transcriptional regulator [Rhodococcus sp. EPR-157]|uniref:helix-turn-helix domain-containing protein n=1 Tax=Rhodococcus sp. EPR-157 TaxID=1813677 RepID=UPI0007BC2DD8|nr:helix-turn-helix transcriptional regulator [Rhodococcus sp. EPR-157]KZF01660.1 transcriptional regulator [Rhodococcus sp. EPR-157]
MPDVNQELADYLKRARAGCDPSRSGLPQDGRVRRVPGLRREEVALLAGVSTDYYTRLEQGRRITPSSGVLDAIARALGLGEAGRVHLGNLVGATSNGHARSRPVQRVRPGLRQLVDSLDGQPALILGRRSDVLASNRMANALFADFESMRPSERNYARWMFVADDARQLFVDWDIHARAAVESLRFDVGNYPDDKGIKNLIDELTSHSTEFRRWWSENRVYQRTFGSKRLRHPLVGELTVSYETLTMPGDPSQTLFVYTTEVGTASHQAMNTLSSWSLTSPTVELGSAPDDSTRQRW